MLPTSLSAATLSPPLSHLLLLPAISLPLSLSTAVASPDTKPVCQCDLKWYILGVENILPSFNCRDLILSERSTTEGRGRGSTVIVFTNPLFNPYFILSMYIVW